MATCDISASDVTKKKKTPMEKACGDSKDRLGQMKIMHQIPLLFEMLGIPMVGLHLMVQAV